MAQVPEGTRAAPPARPEAGGEDAPPRPATFLPPTAPAPDAAAAHPLFVPITGLFVLALIGALIYAAEFLIPLSLAILGNFILNGPRRLFGRLGVPAGAFAVAVTLTLACALAFGTLAVYDTVYKFVLDLPSLLEDVAGTFATSGGTLEVIDRAADATQAVLAGEEQAEPVRVEVVEEGPGIAGSVFAVAPGLLSQTVFAICMLFFLVASGDMFIRKAVQAADRFEDKRRTVETLTLIEARLGRYLGSITLINAGLGTAIGMAMWLWGLPSAVTLGIMGFALNFVPFVGAVVGTAIAGLTAFVAFDDAWTAAGVALTYYALTAFEGQFITPILVSQRLRLNTAVLFLTVAFFAWIWSVMGMIVAVPMLIVLKIVCDATPGLQKLGLFLGDAQGFGTEGMRRPAKPDDA